MFDLLSMILCVSEFLFQMRGKQEATTRFVIDHGPAEESAVRSCGMFLVVMSLVCFLSLSYVV